MVLLLVSLETFLLIALIVLCVLAGPLMIAHVANKQGRNGASWFFLSLLVSPFFAILVLIALGDTNDTRKQRIIEEELTRNNVHINFSSKPQDNKSLLQRLEQSRHS